MKVQFKFITRCFLTIIFLTPATIGIDRTALASDSNSKNKSIEIKFDFYPSALNTGDKSEPVFVTIRGDGKAQAVRYGLYSGDAVKVYEGILSKTDLAALRAKAIAAIPIASRHRRYDTGHQDEETFYLAVATRNSSSSMLSSIEYWGMLGLPSEISSLVDELRSLWKRLKEVRPAYGYLRSVPIKKEDLEYLRQNSTPNFKLIKELPRRLRPTVITAIRNPLNFFAINQAEANILLKFTSDTPHFAVIEKDSGYGLALFLPRTAQGGAINSSRNNDVPHK